MHITTNLAGEDVLLLPQKAIYWPRQKALFIADAHLGKGGHFRKHGLPIPTASITQDLHRLNVLVATHKPETIYYLGDLFHSDPNAEWDLFADWLKQTSAIKHVLILGNHDRALRQHDLQHCLHLETRMYCGPFLLTHEPLETPPTDSYVLCGHIHPGVLLRGKGRQRLRLPCFWLGEQQGILPAFGQLTGAVPIKGKARVFAVAQDDVFAV